MCKYASFAITMQPLPRVVAYHLNGITIELEEISGSYFVNMTWTRSIKVLLGISLLIASLCIVQWSSAGFSEWVRTVLVRAI